ncbi:PREDICTED: N-acetyltransferase 9-like protein [Nicrophorus vespilloides]|uniref:N-acetyltransferase 9-like protein n=1 Tax=Nicrophorus vespilloides TaxID=110193 RepID=A0ABM1NKF5_NICVS|nr:PREDICTED: N-acetyltransferase 9-like protein [Nicrophorus vespilloides]
MLINKNTKIIGERVILVPYRKEHVLKYNSWMQSKELQELTASEPLTLNQEYEMQHSWMLDNDKCTFIILDKEKYEETQNEVAAMIGDTNLFFLNNEDGPLAVVAEAEIMIAEEWARRKGCGWEAMVFLLKYGIDKLQVKQYTVKISANNAISIHMFEKMGFIQTAFTQVFQEVTMEKLVDDQFKQFIKENTKHHLVIEDGEEVVQF